MTTAGSFVSGKESYPSAKDLQLPMFLAMSVEPCGDEVFRPRFFSFCPSHLQGPAMQKLVGG